MNVIHEAQTQTGSRRQRARRQRVEEILSTALVLIEEQGLDALTVQKLAKRMDWAVGALYRYYAGKDALFAALQTRVLAEYSASLEAALARAYGAAPESARTTAPRPDSDRALEAVAFIAEHYRAYAAAHPTRFRMISLSLGEPRELLDDEQAGRVMQSGLTLLGAVAQRVQRAADAGALEPGNALARTLVFWSSVQGVLLMRKLQRLAPAVIDIDALFVDAVVALLCGYGAERARAEQAVARAREALAEIPIDLSTPSEDEDA
ncbi:MAG: TetR family transcriptional regulator [Myxococcales bacterium]|nr:TetR family transcriptional regulator [Myxococcales bacterium]